jgi:hypothetical protein
MAAAAEESTTAAATGGPGTAGGLTLASTLEIDRLREQERRLESMLERTRQSIAVATGGANASATTAALQSATSATGPPSAPSTPIRVSVGVARAVGVSVNAGGALIDGDLLLESGAQGDEGMLDALAEEFASEQVMATARAELSDGFEDDDEEEDEDEDEDDEGDEHTPLRHRRRRRRRTAGDAEDSEPHTSDDERDEAEPPLFDDVRLASIEFAAVPKPSVAPTSVFEAARASTAGGGALPPVCAWMLEEEPTLHSLSDYRAYNAHVRAHNRAIKDVTAVFYNEEHNEIYTGNKLGYIHVWKQ